MGDVEPDWDASALLVIDMQVDFAEGGAAAVPGTRSILPVSTRLARGFRGLGRPIVHVVRLYPPGSSDVDLPRRSLIRSGASIVAPGSPGSAILAGFAGASTVDLVLDHRVLLAGGRQMISDREIVMFKPRWGAFYRTALEGWLRGLGVDTVVVAGCNLPNCPRATLFEASERDFRTVLAVDAVSQVSTERIADLRRIGVSVLPSDVILGQLAEVTGPGNGQEWL